MPTLELWLQLILTCASLQIPYRYVEAIAIAEHWAGSIEATKVDHSRVNVNKDGSIDRGIMQLNSKYFEPMSDVENMEAGANHIAGLIKQHGTMYLAAIAYNAGSSRVYNPPESSIRYAHLVIQIYKDLGGSIDPHQDIRKY